MARRERSHARCAGRIRDRSGRRTSGACCRFSTPMDQDQLEKLEAQVDWMIENIGVAFRDDPVALDIWRKAGVEPTGEHGDLIKADAQLIRDLVAKSPKRIRPARSQPRACPSPLAAIIRSSPPIYGAPFVRDLEKGRRYAEFSDYEALLKLVYMHPNLHHGSFVICEPTDIPVSKRHLDMVFAQMTLSDKPFLGAITEMSRAQDTVDMIDILFGAERLDRDVCIMANVNTNSPLLVDRVVSQAVQVYSGRGQGMVVTPFILTGAMGPVSTAASVCQAVVSESMMVCAFAQLVRPGAPFVMGNFLSSMSLRTGAPTFGMPEPVLSNYMIGQLSRRLGLPLRCGGSLTASKIEDAQAAYESADSMHSTMLAGSNFTLHAAGWLEGGLSTGYEKLIMDADRLGSYQKLLGVGLQDDDNAFAEPRSKRLNRADISWAPRTQWRTILMPSTRLS